MTVPTAILFDLIKKQEDYVAFEKILAEALAIHQVQLFGYLQSGNTYRIVKKARQIEQRLPVD